MWLTPDEVTTTKAAFGDYNRKTLEVFRTMFPNVGLLRTEDEIRLQVALELQRVKQEKPEEFIGVDYSYVAEATISNEKQYIEDRREQLLLQSNLKKLPDWESDDVPHYSSHRCTTCCRWQIEIDPNHQYGPLWGCRVCDK